MNKEEYNKEATDGVSFDDFIQDFFERHKEFYKTEEFNVIVLSQMPVDGMPKKIALSIVLEHKNAKVDTTDEDVPYKIRK